MQSRYSLFTQGLLVYYAAKLYSWQLPQIDFLEAHRLVGRGARPKYSGNCFNCKHISDFAWWKCGMKWTRLCNFRNPSHLLLLQKGLDSVPNTTQKDTFLETRLSGLRGAEKGGKQQDSPSKEMGTTETSLTKAVKEIGIGIVSSMRSSPWSVIMSNAHLASAEPDEGESSPRKHPSPVMQWVMTLRDS